MRVDEVALLWRRWADEPASSNYDNVQLAIILRLAHEQYRKIINDQNRWLLNVSVNLTFPTPTGADPLYYDLSGGEPVVILGDGAPATITNPRMEKAVALRPIVGTDLGDEWVPVSSWEELQGTLNSYMMDSRGLRISSEWAGTFRFDYLPNAVLEYAAGFDTDWSQIGAATENIDDDFQSYHDIIALLAYEYYAITDDPNPKLEQVLTRRVQELEEHIRSRTGWAATKVAQHVPMSRV